MKRQPHRLFGVIGSPLGHTLSPYMHNAAFRKLKLNAAYLPFAIKKDKLKEAMAAFRSPPIAGFNVTIPFKSECIRYIDSIDPVAKKIGAVNTVVVKNKRLKGYNTDYSGFIRSIKEDLKFRPEGKRVFVFGAGGAARAVVFGLLKEGASSISIYDIVGKKAKALSKSAKKSFKRTAVKSCSAREIKNLVKEADLLINCTPLGMKKGDSLPVDIKFLHKKIKVYDIVYNPLETKLIKSARKKGIKAAGGINMLLYQGAEAFELWTKKKAPIALMRKVLLEHL